MTCHDENAANMKEISMIPKQTCTERMDSESETGGARILGASQKVDDTLEDPQCRFAYKEPAINLSEILTKQKQVMTKKCES